MIMSKSVGARSCQFEMSFAESIAIKWLRSENEYSRMLALDTLAVPNSPQLCQAMQILKDDPSPVVQDRQLQIAGASIKSRRESVF